MPEEIMFRAIIKALITLGVLLFLSSCTTTGDNTGGTLFNGPGPSSDLWGFEGG